MHVISSGLLVAGRAARGIQVGACPPIPSPHAGEDDAFALPPLVSPDAFEYVVGGQREQSRQPGGLPAHTAQ